MADRSERERRRAERLEAERREAQGARRRLLLGYAIAGVLVLAIVAGIVVVVAGGGEGGADGDLPGDAHIEPLSGSTNDFAPDARSGTTPPPVELADLEAAAEAAGCELRLDLPDEGATHLRPNQDPPDYETSPPTSGDHDPSAQADGAYSERPDPRYVVHALEHGRIAVQYSPQLPEEDQLALKGVFDEDPAAMLLFPNPEMEYAVAATAWTQLIGCDRYQGPETLDAIRAFRDVYRGRGPEAVPIQLSG